MTIARLRTEAGLLTGRITPTGHLHRIRRTACTTWLRQTGKNWHNAKNNFGICRRRNSSSFVTARGFGSA